MKAAIQNRWPEGPDEKTRRYIGQLFDCSRTGNKIMAKVEGNHGTYTVSISTEGEIVTSTCSCYIGGEGYCHHCRDMGITFLQNPDSFKRREKKKREDIRTIDDISPFRKGVTLDVLLSDLKAKGITQKAFAEGIGMNPRHLGSIKSSELRNRFYNELGAVKLACLWVMENCIDR